MLDMVNLRISYWLEKRHIKATPYSLAKASKGAINQTTAKRLIDGPKRVDLATLDVLCDVFGVEPGELWERDKKRRG